MLVLMSEYSKIIISVTEKSAHLWRLNHFARASIKYSDEKRNGASRDFGRVSFALKLGNEAKYGLGETTPAPATSSQLAKRGAAKKERDGGWQKRLALLRTGGIPRGEICERERERHRGGYGRTEE